MSNKDKENQDVLSELLEEFKDSPPQSMDMPQKTIKEQPLENVETLEDLTNAWKDRTVRPESPKNMVYVENAPIFKDRGDVISYYNRWVVTAPYMHVVLQQLFGDSPEQWVEVEKEANKHMLPRVHQSFLEKGCNELEYWSRVKSTTDFKRRNGVEITDPEWDSFVEYKIHKVLLEVNHLNAICEKAHNTEAESNFRKSKWNRPRRSVND